MPVKISRANGRLDRDQIKRVEKLIGDPFPDDYRTFLLQTNGGDPEANRVETMDRVQSLRIRSFFGVVGQQRDDDLLHNRDGYEGRLPAGVVAVADDDSGNLICLSLRSDDFGGVYLWDHEMEADEGCEPSFANMHLIAHSFHELLDRIEPFDPSSNLKEGQVKSVWVDPDFLREMGEG